MNTRELEGLYLNNSAEISQLEADKADKLKVALIENELNTCKSTLANVNINNEATQTASGYGAVSLPKNAASGNMGVKVEGLTATNLVTNGNLASGTTGWIHYATLSTESIVSGWLRSAKNTQKPYPGREDSMAIANGSKVYVKFLARANKSGNMHFRFASAAIGDTNTGSWTVSLTATSTLYSSVVTTTGAANSMYFDGLDFTTDGDYIEVADVVVINLTAKFGAGNEPNKETCDAMFANWFDGTKSVQTPLRVRSVSSDETQSSSLYLPDVGVLRSVPAAADEVTATEHIKRIDDDGTALATPIITPIQSSGTLVSFPSGTVYVEKAIADAGIYNSGITVLNTDKPISTLESLSKIDFATGQPTPLDASTAVIAGDGLSFTHTGLSDGDIVFFTYFYDAESTEGETSLTYYDSRYVIQDSVTGKYYKVTQAIANGVLTQTLVEV